jgi:hypothetical protein
MLNPVWEGLMEDVGNILPRALKKQLLGQDPRVLEVLRPVWPRVVGKLVAEHCRPAAFSGGTLILSAFNPPWAAQLSQMAEQIRDQINGFLAVPAVRKVRVRSRPGLKRDASTTAPLGNPASPPARMFSQEAVSRILWADSPPSLEPEIAHFVEQSFIKYFSRRAKGLDECV